MAILNNSNAISSGGYDINNSLRFRASASSYLNRTPASSGNRRTFTWSGWVKRGLIATSVQPLFFAEPGSEGSGFYFTQNVLQWYNFVGGTDYGNATTAVFRDPSAWYHIVLAIDTTQATASNRAKVYVNGVEQTFTQNFGDMPQNFDTSINTTSSHLIGKETSLVGTTFDGYMTEVNFIDGQALTPSSFGETDTTTGVWKPKAYTGTYGTNGFYLKFSDIATTSGSNAGLGKDFSGNANYWTTNNISVTAGTTYDAMIDSPTLTSATVANYCVLNPLNKSGGMTLSEANLRMSMDSVGGYSARGTIASSSGKWYAEAFVQNKTTQTVIGVCDVTLGANQDPIVAPVNSVAYYANTGGRYVNGGTLTSYGATYTTNDIIGIALDMDALTVTFYKNNTSQGSIALGTTGLNYTFFAGDENSLNTQIQWNFGQRPFSYTPPTGFVRLNTYNLPDSTAKKGNSYMNTVLYTGDGASSKSITGVGFQPDFTWVKNRQVAHSHQLFDVVRGLGSSKGLKTNATDEEGLYGSQYGWVSSLDTDGFTVAKGSDVPYFVNQSGQNYVGWNWKANGAGSSNTSGSITSTVSVNATAGFSIVTYTGTGANATVGHGLGVAPRMIICKNRASATDWAVYHASFGNTGALRLNSTIANEVDSRYWNNTTPTSTVFTVGSSSTVNGSSNTQVAYCWAEIAGFSKFGSYTGNGSADGSMIFTGFTPKFLMFKRTDTTSGWYIHDSIRNTSNVVNLRLLPNTSDAEATVTTLDFLSNGFKLRTSDVDRNASGGTYIYACFASNPFRNSNAF